jgi:phosphonate transport system substrate-binding protein
MAAALALAAAGLGPAHAQERALRVGLVPYLTPRQMVSVFDPLRQHLQARLARPVLMFTAASLRALADNTRRGDYDVAFMPVHFMRVAAQDWGGRIVARTSAPTTILLATQAARELKLPDGLRGGRVVTLDPLAINTMVLMDWLAEQGLQPGRDLTVEYITAANSVVLSLQRPDVTAVAIIEAAVAEMDPEARRDVRVAARLRTVHSPGYVITAQLPAEERAAVSAALLSFTGQGGAATLSRSPLEPATLEDSAQFERYAQQLRRLLAA